MGNEVRPARIPDGFSDLARHVKRVWLYGRTLPKSPRDMFTRLAYWTLLSGVTNSAQNEYVYSLVKPISTFERVDDRWSLRTKTILEREKTRLLNMRRAPLRSRIRARNLKVDAIGKLLERRMNVNRTLLEARRVVKEVWKAEGNLASWRDDPRVIDLIADVAHENGRFKIYDIGFVKATKWIHTCGVGQQVVPPLGQIARFLAELCACTELRHPSYEYKHLGGLDEIEIPRAITDWAVMNNRCREMAIRISSRWCTAQLVGDTIHFVMYLRGILENQRAARMVTPSAILNHVKLLRVSFTQFLDDAYTADALPPLAERFEAFLLSEH